MTLPADLLRSDIFIHSYGSGKIWQPQDLLQAESHYRQVIYDKLAGDTVGKTIFIGMNDFFTIRAVTKAAWQLGCAVFNQEGHPAYRVMPEFADFYSFVDVIVREDPRHKQDNFGQWMDGWMPEKHVFIDFNWSLEFTGQLPPTDLDTVAVKTHTSGTTGMPRIVDMTNRQILNLARHTIEYNDFVADDVPLHTKTLHHGSLFVNYAIPLLITCQHHHDVDFFAVPGKDDKEKLHGLLQYIKRNRISRVLLPYSTVRDLPDVPAVDLEEHTAINVIHGPYREHIQDLFDRFRPRHLINMFGCSEMGTMMISRTTKHNIDLYHNTRFDIVNPYIDLIVEPDRVRCRWRDQAEWHVLADRLQWKDQAWWHWGRSTVIQSAQGPIDTTLISQYISHKYHSNEFVPVPDFERNLMYLAVFDQSLFQQMQDINQDIEEQFGIANCFHDQSLFDKVSVLIGMKPSNPLLLYYFRNRISGVLDGTV